MTTRTKILTTVAASALAVTAFAAGAGAEGTSRDDVRDACDETHDQMGGVMTSGMGDVDWEGMHDQMRGAMGIGPSFDHSAHHPAGS
ncbi:MAG: hypothetical protein ACLGI8_00790 [Acidimicrobiia bacterium]|jgi:hypothetical protein